MDVLAWTPLFAAPPARLGSVGMRLLVEDTRDIIFDTRVGRVLFVVRAWRRTEAIPYNRLLEFFALRGLRGLPITVVVPRRRRRRGRLGDQCRRVRGLRVFLLDGRRGPRRDGLSPCLEVTLFAKLLYLLVSLRGRCQNRVHRLSSL